VKYIENQFKKLIEHKSRDSLVVYPTCAIHSDQIQTVFESVTDFILVQLMKGSVLMF